MASNSVGHKRYLTFDFEDENNSNKGDVNTTSNNTTPPNKLQLKKKQKSNANNSIKLLFGTTTTTRLSSHSTPNDICEIQQLPNQSSSVHSDNKYPQSPKKKPTNSVLPLSPRKTVSTKPTLQQTRVCNNTITVIRLGGSSLPVLSVCRVRCMDRP